MVAQILLGLAVCLGLLALAAVLSRIFRRRHGFWGRSGRRGMGGGAGRNEEAVPPPNSLRPVFNENRCIGCGSCIEACPEGDVIGMVDFETRLINPSRCLGHGACAAACPMDAITLVVGAAKRGVDIPELKPNFATRVPGLYVAGELAGMGLIGNAVEQARQAMESIRRLNGIGEGDGLDVVIVGAGPAGLSATLVAVKHKLRYATLEQGELGGALLHYPRRKIVSSAPIKLPVIGEVALEGKSKEELVPLWQEMAREGGATIHCRERVESVRREGEGFLVRSDKGEYRARAVLLAVGRSGTPRTLGIPGEGLAKVVYRLADPGQYRNRRVLVVGGGDSAIEAAVAVAMEQPTAVTLVHRGDSFARASELNRERLGEFEAAGRVKVMLRSQVRRIDEKIVEIQGAASMVELLNDDVIVCAGGEGPDELLKGFGLTLPVRAALWAGAPPGAAALPS